MRACKITVCIRGADIVDPRDHKYRHAALDDGTDQSGEALRSEHGSWCYVEVVGQLHVSDEPAKVRYQYAPSRHVQKRRTYSRPC
jgi:hypothetical protein